MCKKNIKFFLRPDISLKSSILAAKIKIMRSITVKLPKMSDLGVSLFNPNYALEKKGKFTG